VLWHERNWLETLQDLTRHSVVTPAHQLIDAGVGGFAAYLSDVVECAQRLLT
jgi:hypothetical protein